MTPEFLRGPTLDEIQSTYHLNKKLPMVDGASEEPALSNGPMGSMSGVVSGGVCG